MMNFFLNFECRHIFFVLINKINGKSFFYCGISSQNVICQRDTDSRTLNAIIIIWQMVIYTQAPLFTVETFFFRLQGGSTFNISSSVERGA